MRAVNLIPTEQRSGTSVGAGRSEGGAYAVLALAAGLAVMALLYGLARHDVSSSRAQAASATAKSQQAVTAAERLAPYTSFVAQREQRVQAVEAIVNSRFDWAHVFHEIGRVLPVETSINSLTGTVGSTGSSSSSSSSSAPSPSPSSASSSSTAAAGASSSASVASATPAGTVPTFTLAGCALSQPAVALMLERLRLIDGVSEVALQSSTASAGGGGEGGGGTGGGCPEHAPAFTVAITFDALPSTSAVASATKAKNVSEAAGAGAKAAPTTTSGGPK